MPITSSSSSEDELVGDSVEDELVGDALVDELVGDSVEDELVGDALVDELVGYPVEDELVGAVLTLPAVTPLSREAIIRESIIAEGALMIERELSERGIAFFY
jgi:hypothetical protein